LRQVVIAKEGLSRLGVLSNLPPLSIFDMFHAIGGRVKAHYG
jgi:hypothetical protein